MKYIIIPVALFALFFTSCTQCYECSQIVEIESNGQVVGQDTIVEDRCAVSSDEVNQWEESGQSCKAI